LDSVIKKEYEDEVKEEVKMDKNEFNDILDEHIDNMKKEPVVKKV
jgi:hypothetical protein